LNFNPTAKLKEQSGKSKVDLEHFKGGTVITFRKIRTETEVEAPPIENSESNTRLKPRTKKSSSKRSDQDFKNSKSMPNLALLSAESEKVENFVLSSSSSMEFFKRQPPGLWLQPYKANFEDNF
jgi:hypothetical protein